MGQGRPSDYSPELADEICARLADGESLRAICRDVHMPNKATVFKWLRIHKSFNDQYAIAKEESADAWADEIVDIADNEVEQPLVVDGIPMTVDGKLVMVKDAVSVNHAKLRIDTRKWAASKLKPKKYGDRVTSEITGKDGGPIQTEDVSDRDLARWIAFTLTKATKADDSTSN